MPNSADTLVQIAQTYSVPEARILQGLLAAYEIPAHLDGLEHACADWTMTVALGGVRGWVPQHAAAVATAALSPKPGPAAVWEAKAFWRRPLLYAALVFVFLFPTVFPPWLRLEWRASLQAEEALQK